MDKLLNFDREVFLYLNNLGSENWDWFWLFITNKWASIPLYALLLFLLYKKTGWKGTLISLVVIALMITSTDQFANVFKHGFERPRPCQEAFDRARFIAVRCGRYGFFSAHAASSFALAVFLGNILKKYYQYALFLMLFWALVVSYSRIYVGVHYPGDVLVGMFFGSILGYLFYRLQQFLVIILEKNTATEDDRKK